MFPPPFYGADLLVRLIFFSALVMRWATFSVELKNPLSFKKILALHIAYIFLHEFVRYSLDSEVSRQIFTSTITTLFSLIVGLLALKLYKHENLKGSLWISLVFLLYTLIFAFRVHSLITGTSTTNQLASSIVTDVIAISLVIFPVIDNLGYLAMALERAKREEQSAKQTIIRNQAFDLLSQQITHLDRKRALTYMAASIAHEINQPLTVIRSCVQLAQGISNSPPSTAANISDVLKILAKNADHAIHTVAQIRSYIKPSTQAYKEIDITTSVTDAITLINPQLTSNNIELSTSGINKSALVYGSQIEITQILVNILQNSCDAMPDMVSKNIYIELTSDTDFVKICIKDSGPGYSSEVIDNLRNDFFTTKPTGMGLGLSISQFIMNQHNGEIKFSNKPSGGAITQLIFPKIILS